MRNSVCIRQINNWALNRINNGHIIMQDKHNYLLSIHIYSDIASNWDFLEILYYLEQVWKLKIRILLINMDNWRM